MLPNPLGMAAVFGPPHASTAKHIQSVSESLRIPHIETRYDYSSQSKEFAINIHPKPSTLGKVRLSKSHRKEVN